MNAISVHQCVQRIQSCWPRRPRAAIILGTGLGGLTERIETQALLPYRELPGFSQPTAVAHRGQFVCGELAGVPIIALQGRVHYYEGYDWAHITHPVHVAARLGCELFIVSNASGGLNPHYRSGDIMILDDHIDLMGTRNVVGSLGESRASAVKPVRYYDAELGSLAQEVARRQNFSCQRGVYVAVTGPNYETRAEYRFMRRIGGDVVGMSTVPEVLAAREFDMRVLALSVVTNVAKPDAPDAVDALEVVDIAEHAEPKLRALTIGVLTS